MIPRHALVLEAKLTKTRDESYSLLSDWEPTTEVLPLDPVASPWKAVQAQNAAWLQECAFRLTHRLDPEWTAKDKAQLEQGIKERMTGERQKPTQRPRRVHNLSCEHCCCSW